MNNEAFKCGDDFKECDFFNDSFTVNHYKQNEDEVIKDCNEKESNEVEFEPE